MTENLPPEWGNDPFSKFFSDAEYNDRATAANYAQIYAHLKHVDAVFRKVEEAIENDNREALLVPRFLIVRTHSAFLATVRLAMSGQHSEAFAVLRGGIELAWYALHIANNPDSAKIWLCRNDDDASKAKCKTEFTIKNVRTTHEKLDAATARELQDRYENLIDFGAHPNQRGTTTSLSKSEGPKQVDFKIGILFPNEVTVPFALRMAAAVAIGALRSFQLIYPERFKLMGIDLEIEKLIGEVNTVFKPYVPKSNSAAAAGPKGG